MLRADGVRPTELSHTRWQMTDCLVLTVRWVTKVGCWSFIGPFEAVLHPRLHWYAQEVACRTW